MSTTKVQIRSRWDSKVIYEAEVSAEEVARARARLYLWQRPTDESMRLGVSVRRAVSTGADLTGAVLTDAVLTDAVLTRAVLTRADLTGAREDLVKVLDAAPVEVPALLAALREGRIHGTMYRGDCACLMGTIANARGCDYLEIEGLTPDSERPAEILFFAIRPGHTPALNPVAKVVEGWIVEWMAKQAEPTTTLVTE